MKKTKIIFLAFALTSCLEAPILQGDISALDDQDLISLVNKYGNWSVRLNPAQAFEILSRISTFQQEVTEKINDDYVRTLYNKLTEDQQMQLQEKIKTECLDDNFYSIFKKSDGYYDVSNMTGVIKLSDDLKKTAFSLILKAFNEIEITSLHMENIQRLKKLLDGSRHSSDLKEEALAYFRKQYSTEKEKQENKDSAHAINVANQFRQFVSIFDLVDKFSEKDIKNIEHSFVRYSHGKPGINPIRFSVLNLALEKNGVTAKQINNLVNQGASVLAFDRIIDAESLYPMNLAATKGLTDVIDILFSSYEEQHLEKTFQEHAQTICSKSNVSAKARRKLEQLID